MQENTVKTNKVGLRLCTFKEEFIMSFPLSFCLVEQMDCMNVRSVAYQNICGSVQGEVRVEGTIQPFIQEREAAA